MLVVNLFGAPGSGKSTLALLTAGFLKTRYPHLTTECPDEVAKTAVYDGIHKMFEDQIYLTAAQYRQVARCRGHTDIVVTDSPVLMGAVYGEACSPPYPEEYREVCWFLHRKFTSFNFLVARNHAFETAGRIHDEADADRLHTQIKMCLESFDVVYSEIHSTEACAANIAEIAATGAKLANRRI